jgi:RNA polymerase-binding transcription factor DksA
MATTATLNMIDFPGRTGVAVDDLTIDGVMLVAVSALALTPESAPVAVHYTAPGFDRSWFVNHGIEDNPYYGRGVTVGWTADSFSQGNVAFSAHVETLAAAVAMIRAMSANEATPAHAEIVTDRRLVVEAVSAPSAREMHQLIAAAEAEEAGLASGRFVHCPNCGAIVPQATLLAASRGTACPNCYDNLSN